MRIPDVTLRSVGFVCETTHSEGESVFGDPYATGFFAKVSCESPELQAMEMYYFVTAKHVAADLENRPIHFLVNKRGGGRTHRVIAAIPTWFLHPTDKNADIAAVQVALMPEEVDIMPIGIEHFALPDRLKKLNIGVGDEVHSIGLFSPVPGEEAVTPIARFGNISMMPAEKVQTELGFTEMYLVEARSIGGMSGSPVFVRPTYGQLVARADRSNVISFSVGSGETLLGMAQGHWDIREEDINKPTFTQDRKRGVNYGIALVVPAFKIYETLYQPELVEMRKRLEQAIVKSVRSVPGSDSPKETEGKVPTVKG